MNQLQLTVPKPLTFWISAILGGLGVLGHYFILPVLTEYDFWFLFFGFALMMAGLGVKDL
jgi:hypothetical protein